MLIVLKLTEISCSCWNPIKYTFQIFPTAAREAFNLYLKSVFKEILHIKNHVIWKNEKQNNLKTLAWTCHAWNKGNIENVIFYLILYKNKTAYLHICKFNSFNIGTVNVIQKKFV